MIKLQKFTAFTVINVCVFLFIYPTNINAQGFGSTSPISNITATATSGEKPQSKVWKHDDIWWAVIPISTGTYIYHLDVNNNWVQGLQLSSSTTIQADTKNVGSITYILLFDGNTQTSSSLEIVTYNSTNKSYSVSVSLSISFSSTVETATIDIDSNQRIWVAYEESNSIYVKYSDSPSYSAWSSPLSLASGVKADDIAAVTAFGGNKIGVMWSNQNAERFGFRYRDDSPSVPSVSDFDFFSDEVPASQSALNKNGGMADDHISFAVASNGTIYAAVKTAYDFEGYPSVALLVRRPDKSWDDLYSVKKQIGNHQPTRPIALLDETNEIITVVYTQDVGGNDIMYKSSSAGSIDFFADAIEFYLIEDVKDVLEWNNVTSTKQSFNPDVVILTSSGSTGVPFTSQTWTGVIGLASSPTPVELAFFAGTLNGNNVELRWRTETEVNNYGFYIERAIENLNWLALGFVEGHGNSNSPKQYTFIDSDIYESDNYYYRLKQIDNDGTFEYSDVVTVTVGVPVLFALSQNYPNPFNPETIINYTLPEQQNVSLRVYNMLGELVKELVNEVKPAGTYTVTFDGSSAAGGLPSGIYVYRIQTERFSENKKMTLLK